ncbi:transcriptional regulator GcvA [Sneathiella sp. P13V-1]|uniref:transcriptional regulator GcvA n=1 Tax=Sneathiella sp. P13V-1 TaxID=2697366 RepID=UPI00187B2EF3|nr:transcriptional regulator GcvA [Sneathiella sp. P13V-1]MBE7636658.1 transcriptional regulator GcvA [Sneathiella sp. P13V-1]
MLIIPSNSGLKSFESAARHLSFNKAAEELNVTPGAVSRQIQSLEEFLGKTLFHRHHKKVELTAIGRQYHAEISQPLQKISAASDRIRTTSQNNTLSICTYPSFAVRWLIPRWAKLHEDFPDLNIQLTTSLNAADYLEDGFDMSIQVLKEGYSQRGFNIDKLLDVKTFPVCSPTLAKEIRSFEDLNKFPLLHESPRPTDWPRWCEYAGASKINANGGMNFESADMALHAAIEGIGVVIGIDILIREDIKNGRLVKLFDLERPSTHPFHVVTSTSSRRNPNIEHLKNWLLEEAGHAEESGQT